MSKEITPAEVFGNNADEYLDKHGVHGLFSSLLHKLCLEQPKDPIEFLIKSLEKPHHVLQVLVLGPPGAGVDAQAWYVAESFGVVRVKVDEVVESEIKKKSKEGKILQETQDKGQTYPPEIVAGLLKARVSAEDAQSKGWVLDGFPSSRREANALQQAGVLANRVILLNLPEDVAASQLLQQESTLTLEQATRKVRTYNRNVAQFWEFYRGVSTAVDAQATADEVSSSIDQALQKPTLSDAPHRPKRICVVGPYGSGKGTQCSRLAQRHGLVHLSTGDILRLEISKNSALGEQVAPFINAGTLVPDGIVVGLVRKRLLQKDCKRNGFVLDGFPRSLAQAHALQDMNIRPARFVLLDVPDQVAIERVVNRRVDPVNNDEYHLKHSPPPSSIADRLVHRDQDKPDYVDTVNKEYRNSIEELKIFYKDILKTVDGNRTQDEVEEALQLATHQLIEYPKSSS